MHPITEMQLYRITTHYSKVLAPVLDETKSLLTYNWIKKAA